MKTIYGPDGISCQINNVTGRRYGADIDFNLFDGVRWAPAWLTSAERMFLYTLIYSLQVRRYLEIGVLHGGASLIVSKAMDALNHEGKLILIDPEPQIAPDHWAEMAHRSILLQGYSPKILPEAREAAGGDFDFVFIDASHSKDAVLRDANGVMPIIQDGAYILFHDAFHQNVKEAIDAFTKINISRIVDFGLLTREYTKGEELEENGCEQIYCGLRLVQFRRRHGLLRPINRLRGVCAQLYTGISLFSKVFAKKIRV